MPPATTGWVVVDPVEPRLTVRRLVEGGLGVAVTVTGDEPYRTDQPFPVTVTPGDLPC